ncbi:guanitoxin biosynthesis heme-dependent pre-guanitoxin N-hydroxylase GntA [Janthinobacterium fluminis]|uniref:Guanitoxin biosynthesis heme-dependent pre-guanitoxin N-hydroxylase GntA n=1 Tax=Janthinobacterium fluminis TaxID=2987524 RepID=A0ABT5K6A1_9BURK|nr:guanitoxin biosynthesis heme-dependent pre-guanitoxin N-hydroxylase GntA [Janthinobacterium fluminis]MDC8759955.1 guanitoxin biosynthesis heme-dependent pre-guanitoxin N-hydroxylase GntA [Janthinobacterium fluminis]
MSSEMLCRRAGAAPEAQPAAANPRPWNPLATAARAPGLSSYAACREAVLRPLADAGVDPAVVVAHRQLRELVTGAGFPCVGARSAFNRRDYRFGLYPALASDAAVAALCHDLYEFCHEFAVLDDRFVTYVALFRGGAGNSELQFEQALWRQLQAMHALDAGHFDWDARVACDPRADQFSFSMGGHGMFIVGLHPAASRRARVFPYPALAFNLHEQFELLRQRGKFEMLKQIIRARDMALQGSHNPMLSTFGSGSEARQYSGRAVPDNWQCPFHPQPKSDTTP